MKKEYMPTVRVSTAVLFVVLLVLGIALLYPMFYTVAGSLTTQYELDQMTGFFPKLAEVGKNLRNFVLVFQLDGVFRSVLVTLLRFAYVAVLNIFCSTLFGFIFARVEFKGKTLCFMLLLFSMMIPGICLTIPNFLFFGSLKMFGESGLIDSPALLFVVGLIPVGNIFLYRQMIASLGGEYSDAAEIDGANFFQIVFVIYMPMLAPVIALSVIGQFNGTWSDYMTCLFYLPSLEEWWTVGYKFITVMEHYMSTDVHDYPKMYATSLVSILPCIILFFALQKNFMEGMSIGGVKG